MKKRASFALQLMSPSMDSTMLASAAVGTIAVGIEIYIRTSSRFHTLPPSTSQWRAFVWVLCAALVGWRLLLEIAFRIGGHMWEKVAHNFGEDVSGNKPAARFHNIVRRAMIKGPDKLDSSEDVEHALLHLLKEEASGTSSVIWLLALVIMSAYITGIPLENGTAALRHGAAILITARVSVLLTSIIDILHEACASQHMFPRDSVSVRQICHLVKAGICVMGLLFVLSNSGYDVSSTLTGIGLSGLMVGLASQNLLQDFSSFMKLIIHRPFALGDFISVGDSSPGVVERIDFLQTWIRIGAGEVQQFPNKVVASATIANYTLAQQQLLQIPFEISALTKSDQLRVVEDLAKAAVEATGNEFNICWITAITEWGFQFELRAIVKSSDYKVGREARTKIWLNVMKSLEEVGICLANAEKLKRMNLRIE